ncbi:MAG: amidinotransferase [Saprospiraceae bacterium]|nr:amidinotransferase [Saprospiraceae bacterium]
MPALTNNIVMIRPAHFGYNAETAVNNAFQQKATEDQNDIIRKEAIREFDNMVEMLRSKGVNVEVVQDTDTPVKPDAVFPNNWISMHDNGSVITYPMYAQNRRIERREDLIEAISLKYRINNQYSFTFYEDEGEFLEGTGSMIFDRENAIVYACLSPRTHITLIDKFNLLMKTKSIVFKALDKNNQPIYHTNVMMALGQDFVVICMDCIPDEDSKKQLISSFEKTGKQIVEITYDQVDSFAGNMLEVLGKNNERYLVMSKTAFDSLNDHQKDILSQKTNILPVPIPTIETYGGGSVRCMMAENFLPVK